MSVVNCFEHQPGLFCHACIFFLNRFLKVAFAVMLCQLLDTMLWFIVDIYNDIWSMMVSCLSGNHLTFLYVYIDCVWFDVTLKRDMWNIFRRPVFIGARRKPLPSLEKLTIGVNKDRSRINQQCLEIVWSFNKQIQFLFQISNGFIKCLDRWRSVIALPKIREHTQSTILTNIHFCSYSPFMYINIIKAKSKWNCSDFSFNMV